MHRSLLHSVLAVSITKGPLLFRPQVPSAVVRTLLQNISFDSPVRHVPARPVTTRYDLHDLKRQTRPRAPPTPFLCGFASMSPLWNLLQYDRTYCQYVPLAHPFTRDAIVLRTSTAG